MTMENIKAIREGTVVMAATLTLLASSSSSSLPASGVAVV
jgi:hypothetical protein